MTNVYEKTINTCERMTIEIDEWGKNPRLFSFTHYHISLLKVHKNENKFGIRNVDIVYLF